MWKNGRLVKLSNIDKAWKICIRWAPLFGFPRWLARALQNFLHKTDNVLVVARGMSKWRNCREECRLYSGIVLDVAWESEAGQVFLYLAHTFLAFRMGLSNARGTATRKLRLYQCTSRALQWIFFNNANNETRCNDSISWRLDKLKNSAKLVSVLYKFIKNGNY